ncbi:MAG: LuxR C-terminal-related transcriptional regulator [Proteobacteria bacterium]|nr:LuxR C-terminal-related transcriptional regulator [Pseudomonadota bacterium]
MKPDNKERSPRLTQIATKLSPPRTTGPYVLRSRLHDTLSLCRFREFALIQAPAGFGKTSLLARWRQEIVEAGGQAAWFSIDEDDNDFYQFFSYVTAAFQQAAPGLCMGTHSLLQAGPMIPEKAIISTMINELSSIDSPIFLILDDYHLITESIIHQILDYFISHIPENIHLMMASRSEPPLQIAKMRAKNKLIEINVQEMRFTVSESFEFLNHLMGLRLSQPDIDRLHDITEGWAGGLQLASILLLKQKDRTQFIDSFSGNIKSVRDYLAMDVLSLQPEPVVSFLLKTSILKRFCSDLCNEVTENTNSRKMLRYLETNNLFTFPLDEEQIWYRYHHLFSQFLQEQLHSKHPLEAKVLHTNACQWFKNHGLMDEAVYHALAAEDNELSLKLIEDCAMDLISEGHLALLTGWIKKLPDQLLKNRPKLQMAIAWTHCLTNRTEEAESIMDAIVSKGIPNEPAILVELNAIRAVCAAFRQDIIRAEQLATRWMEKSPKNDPWIVGVIGNVLTYSYLHLGNFDKAREINLWALKYQKSARGLFAFAYGIGLLGRIHTVEGRLHGAARQYRTLIQLAEDIMGTRPGIISLAYALLYEIYYEWNDLDGAQKLLDNCLDLIDFGTAVDPIVACHIPYARTLARKGKMTEALTLLERIEDLGNRQDSKWLLAAVFNERIRLFLAEGRLEEAQNILASKKNRMNRRERAFVGLEMLSNELEKTAEARIYIHSGKADQAIEIIEQLLGDVIAFGFKKRQIELEALLSIACFEAGRAQKALQCLVRALTQAKPQNMIRTFADEGDIMKGLIRMIMNNEAPIYDLVPEVMSTPWQKYLNDILSAFETESPPENTLPISKAPQPEKTEAAAIDALSQREYEVLSILSKGLSNKEIANALNMTINTVKWHLKNLFGKLGVSNRTEAINEARQMGILE